MEGTATSWQRVGSSEPFFSSGERCEPAKSAKPERPHPSHFASLFLVPSPLSSAEAPAWYSSNNGKHAYDEDTGEWEPERDARWPGRGRPGLPLTRCSPLEEDSFLDAILSYCLEINIWGWVENDHISPKTQKRNQLETAILILLIYKCKEHQDLQLSMNLINFLVFFKTLPKVKKEHPSKCPSNRWKLAWNGTLDRSKSKIRDIGQGMQFWSTRRIDTIHLLPRSLPPVP